MTCHYFNCLAELPGKNGPPHHLDGNSLKKGLLLLKLMDPIDACPKKIM